MASGRLVRINALLRSEISELIAREMKDPRIGGLVSVTEVETSADLRHAKVYVSVLGTEEERASTLQALKSASGFLRHEVAQRVTFRHTPDFEFRLDSSIEHGTHIMKLLRDVAADDESKKPTRRRARKAVESSDA